MLSPAYYLNFPANLSVKGLYVIAVTEVGLRLTSLSALPAPVRHGVCCIYHFLAIECQKPLCHCLNDHQEYTVTHSMVSPSYNSFWGGFRRTGLCVWVTVWKNHLAPGESVHETLSKKAPRHGCFLLCSPSHRQQTATACQALTGSLMWPLNSLLCQLRAPFTGCHPCLEWPRDSLQIQEQTVVFASTFFWVSFVVTSMQTACHHFPLGLRFN